MPKFLLMKIWRKLLYFGIGLSLGVLMVNFIFGGRTDIQCNYFPNDRVLYDIRNKEQFISKEIRERMQSAKIDTSDLSDLLKMGNVDFKSSARGLDSCKTYWIDFKPDNKPRFGVEYQNCDSLATMINFRENF